MPEYDYICDGGCDTKFTLVSSIQNYQSTPVCPGCNENRDVRRNYEEYIVNTSIKLADDDVKVHHLAERNSEKTSADERAAIHYKHNEYRYKKSKVKLGKNMQFYDNKRRKNE